MPKLKVLSVAAGLLLVAGVLLAVDPVSVLQALQQVPTGHIIAAFAIVQLQVVLSALRWRFTAARLGHPLPISLAVREYYIGTVLNQILPGGIVGDATRVYRSKDDNSGGWKRAAIAVALERLSGQMAFFVLASIGLLTWFAAQPQQFPLEASILMWLLPAIGIAIVILLFIFATPLRRQAARYAPDLRAAFWTSGAAWIQFGLSSLVVGTYVATFLIASDAVGAPLPMIAAVTAVPLCLLTMLVPIGIGGWGTREAAAAALWPLYGFTGAEGLAASLLYGLFSLAGAALPGLIVFVISIITAQRRKN